MASDKIYVSGNQNLFKKYQDFLAEMGSSLAVTLQNEHGTTKNRFSFTANIPNSYKSPEMVLFSDSSLRSGYVLNKATDRVCTIFTSEKEQLVSLYGTKATFQLNTTQTGDIQEQMYVPKQMDARISIDNNVAGVSKQTGLSVNWTTDNDPLNDKGILIELFYDAYTNKSVSTNPTALPNDNVIQYVVVPDNGNYTLTSSDLVNLPSNTNITIKIHRGNFRTVNIGQKENVSLLAYSQVYNAFTLVD